MGIFSNIKNAKGSGSGLYLNEGQHDLKILACKQKKGWNGKTSFIAEFEVLESTTLPKGSRPAWVVKLKDDPVVLDLQLADIKDFLAAAGGCSTDDIEEADLEAATSVQNPLAGTRIRAISVNRPTRAGGVFTKNSWATVSE